MLQEETLTKREDEKCEEPNGEFLAFVSSTSRSITVLTRIDNDKVGGSEEETEEEEEKEEEKPVPNPSDYTIAELKELFSERQFEEAAKNLMYDMETNGKDRKTAKAAIKDL